MSEELLNEFFEFIYKRQLIWYKRFVLKQSWPWTDDEILKTYIIINVYRELDKCTIYLLDKLREIKSREALFLNIVFFRFFNRKGLYEELKLKPFNKIDEKLKNKIISRFDNIKESGKPIFNNAYLISSGKEGQKKHISIMDNLSDIDVSALIKEIDSCKNPEESLEAICKIPMVGPFLACEIWTDLSYIKFFKQGWTDNDFVNVGPGAKWGLEIIFDKKLNKREQIEKLKYLYDFQKEHLENIKSIPKWKEIAFKEASSNYPYLSITNIEGSLCEFRKYHNLSKGKGKRRYFTR